jgi:hypothetical protein
MAVERGAAREAASRQLFVDPTTIIALQMLTGRVRGLVETEALVGIEGRADTAQPAALGAVRLQLDGNFHGEPLQLAQRPK